MSDQYKHRFSAFWTEELGAAVRALAPKSFSMSLAGNREIEAVRAAVNQGIDAYLEACYCPARGDSYEFEGHRLVCAVSAESLPVLVRRLLTADDEEANSRASAICETIDIELI